MPDSFEALAIIVLALLPGALYVWSVERFVGRWGISLADRFLRFIGVSAVLHVMAAPLTYVLWGRYLASGALPNTPAFPWGLWCASIGYVAVPIVLGSAVGIGTIRNYRWVRLLTGPNPAPRAWDHLFSRRRRGWIRLRLKSGTWLAGVYIQREDGEQSYAAGYPEPSDIYLVNAVDVDAKTGRFLLSPDGRPIILESGILIRWEEVEYLEFVDA